METVAVHGLAGQHLARHQASSAQAQPACRCIALLGATYPYIPVQEARLHFGVIQPAVTNPQWHGPCAGANVPTLRLLRASRKPHRRTPCLTSAYHGAGFGPICSTDLPWASRAVLQGVLHATNMSSSCVDCKCGTWRSRMHGTSRSL